MSTHPTEADSPALIRVAAINAAATRAEDALKRLRAADFDAGLAKDFRLATERTANAIAHEITAALDELKIHALGINKEETR